MNQHTKNKESTKGLLNSRLKLEEMITLGVLKGSKNSVVKKMLHAPTLKVYAVKEEPINNKEVRKNIKEWITYWQNQFNEQESYVKVYGTFWNQPEGCVSILLEYLEGNSLQNLLESFGMIPEFALK